MSKYVEKKRNKAIYQLTTLLYTKNVIINEYYGFMYNFHVFFLI